jgi:hypothetical protein
MHSMELLELFQLLGTVQLVPEVRKMRRLSVNLSCADRPELCPVAVIRNFRPPSVSVI